MERGNATGQTFSSEAAAKRTVLELNDAWRAQGAKKRNPDNWAQHGSGSRTMFTLVGPQGEAEVSFSSRDDVWLLHVVTSRGSKVYEAPTLWEARGQGEKLVGSRPQTKSNPRSRSNPHFGNGLLHDDDVFLDLQAIWKRGISPDVKPYRLRNYTERQTKKFYAQYGSGILNHADDYEMAVADWARTYPPTDLMKKANPARPLRRNFLGLFGPKGPRFKVDEHRRDIRNKVEVVSETVGEEDLRWQLFMSGIRKAELDSAFAQAKAAPKTTFYNKHGDLVEVTRIEAKAKANPRQYKEGRDPSGMYKLSDLKKGEFFKRKPTARKVYTKGEYDRGSKKYGCGDYEAVGSEIFLKGDTLVYVGFDY
jgi:hypothetical protein